MASISQAPTKSNSSTWSKIKTPKFIWKPFRANVCTPVKRRGYLNSAPSKRLGWITNDSGV